MGIAYLVLFVVVFKEKRVIEEEYLKQKRSPSFYTPKVKNRNFDNRPRNLVNEPRKGYGTLTEHNLRLDSERREENGVKTYVMIDGRLIDSYNL